VALARSMEFPFPFSDRVQCARCRYIHAWHNHRPEGAQRAKWCHARFSTDAGGRVSTFDARELPDSDTMMPRGATRETGRVRGGAHRGMRTQLTRTRPAVITGPAAWESPQAKQRRPVPLSPTQRPARRSAQSRSSPWRPPTEQPHAQPAGARHPSAFPATRSPCSCGPRGPCR